MSALAASEIAYLHVVEVSNTTSVSDSLWQVKGQRYGIR